jgi:amino acid transporter
MGGAEKRLVSPSACFYMNAMLFLAVSTLDKIKNVPPKVWWWVAGCIVGFFVVVFVLKKIAQINKVFLGIAAFVALMFVFVSWVYNRNEPAILTPFVDEIAPFFPTAGAYQQSQHKPVDPSEQGKNQPQQQTPPPPPPSHVY